MRKKFLPLCLFAAAGVVFAVEAGAQDGRLAYREGEVIVKYKDGALRSLSSMDTLYRRVRVVDVKRFHGTLKGFEHLSFDSAKQDVQDVVAELERSPEVEYVQPNYLLYAHDLEVRDRPNFEGQSSLGCENLGETSSFDCEFNALSSDSSNESSPLANPSLPGRGSRPGVLPRPADPPSAADPSMSLTWGVTKIGSQKAWEKVRGSRSVLVAVIDTGIDYNHPDLATNVWRNPNFGKTRATGIDVEANGVSGDLVGWDFVHNDNLPYDDAGHGSHVSGTIGAVGSNGKGVSGVSQRVSIMAVKFLGANGVGDTANAIRGIDYAISRGAKILNNSWGGGGANLALRDAIRRSADAGALFVASAGNSGTNNDSSPSYPASFNLPNVIAVAATNSKDGLASFSNTGARSVHVGAPGVSIYSTMPGGRYGYMSGTSMAAPHVSGAAALIWAAYPQLSAAQVKQRLLLSGDPLGSLQGRTITGRRINVWRALQ